MLTLRVIMGNFYLSILLILPLSLLCTPKLTNRSKPYAREAIRRMNKERLHQIFSQQEFDAAETLLALQNCIVFKQDFDAASSLMQVVNYQKFKNKSD